jgi:hypothetical protein
MVVRFLLAMLAVLVFAAGALGQADATHGGWRNADTGMTVPATSSPLSRPITQTAAAVPAAAAQPASAPTQPAAASARAMTRVTAGSGTLPNDQGQLWREYDISPYTLRVTTTNRPEQAIVDWILRETGYEAWHSEPLAVLSATPRVLRVYHTPEMQAVVADVVERFVSSNAETQAFGLQVVTVSHPNWRAKAHRLLTPVQVQTPGVQAWLVQKEEAAALVAELRRRSDFREHSSPHLLVNNGQSTVVSASRARNYLRDVALRADAWPGFEPQSAFLDEGFSLEFCPLLSVDGHLIDATIKCSVDQVEKMIPVVLDVPTTVAPRQRTQIEVPQIVHFRFHERFRWPVDKTLLVAMGMIAPPVSVDSKALVPGLPIPAVSSGPPRAELLVFIESKGKAAVAPVVPQAAQATEATTYQGRY